MNTEQAIQMLCDIQTSAQECQEQTLQAIQSLQTQLRDTNERINIVNIRLRKLETARAKA